MACGRPLGATGAVFDVAQGGVVCGRCPGLAPVAAGPGALAVLRGLQAASWDARLGARIASPLERQAAGLLDHYVATLSGATLRTPRFLAHTLPAGTGSPPPC